MFIIQLIFNLLLNQIVIKSFANELMLTGGEEETGGAHIGREKGSDGPQFPFPRSFGIPFQSTYFVAYILLDICM